MPLLVPHCVPPQKHLEAAEINPGSSGTDSSNTNTPHLLGMLPNSRKIPAVPSANHYQTDPTTVIQEDAQHSATTSTPPVINSGKTGGFFSRFARRRSQSTAAVTPKQLPKPSESISTKTGKPTPPLPHQLHDTVPASRSTIPKVQRKPIASEPVSSKNLFLLYNEKVDANSTSNQNATSQSSSAKPVIKKVWLVRV